MTIALQTLALSPEMTFLLGCLQRYFNDAPCGGSLPAWPGETTWPALLDMARQHAVLPHLYHSIRTIDAAQTPSAGLSELQEQFAANTQHNLYLTGTLRAILRAFEARGIAALPYKGPALAMRLYGNIALRQFGDLDILVRPRDARPAIELLLGQGYRPLNPGGITTALLSQFRKVCELWHPESQVCVELHWSLTSWTFYFPLDLASIWTRLDTISVADEPVRTMGIEDTLLMLCVHGAKHQWGRLGWLCDVAALLRKFPDLDWSGLFTLADQLGGIRMLLLGLHLVQAVLRAPLPEAVERRLQDDSELDVLATHARSHMLANQALSAEAVDHPAFYLGLRTRRQDRIRCHLYSPTIDYHRLGKHNCS